MGRIVFELSTGTIENSSTLLEKLAEIFPEFKIVKHTDIRIIYFVEYLFFQAGGPYSPTFDEILPIIKIILENYPPMRNLLDSSADHALANMVLGGRGNLKFEINDRYELMKVLRAWEYLGLRPRTHRSVFRAIQQKPNVLRRLQKPDIFLLARLSEIFPQWRKEINHTGINIQEEIYQQQKSRFGPLLELLKARGLSIEEIITQENIRDLPVGIHRNNFLSYVLKAKHNFTCQLATRISMCAGPVQSHHITPLSKGGEDKSGNIIILCENHHRVVHQKRLQIILMGSPPSIHIKSPQISFNIASN